MTASMEHPRAVPRSERRIIERPRLIKLLDESEARVILLLAPAGYGKTTLARQWFKTLNGAIWISLTPAHRDVATFTMDLAKGLHAERFFANFLGARSNPQRAAREVARAIADRLDEAGIHWLVVDDYHEVDDGRELDEMFAEFEARASARILVASRRRPTWATARRAVYTELDVIERDDLAMTEAEASLILGRRTGVATVISQADGWPAVLGLAAASRSAPPTGAPLPDTLYDYFAEELFATASPELQEWLLDLSLGGDRLNRGSTDANFAELADEAGRLGFVGVTDNKLHPLIREFLFAKVAARPDADSRAREAIGGAAAAASWDQAFDLALRFDCGDLIPGLIERAYRPLTESGRIATLESVAKRARASAGFPPAVVDLVEAEVALRDGELDLAAAVAQRVLSRMPRDHSLYSRAAVILGQATFFKTAFADAASAYGLAEATARTDRDETEALHGLTVASIFGETRREEARRALERLAERRSHTPTDLVRFSIIEVARRRFDEGYAQPLGVDDALRALPLVDDPRVRTSFLYTCASAFALQAEYDRAAELSKPLTADIEQFSLDFARPYAYWTHAMVALGRRNFGEADRLLRAVEDIAAATGDPGHRVNAALLRARLFVQTLQLAAAAELLVDEPPVAVMPSWKGEYFATRSVVRACQGDAGAALAAIDEAQRHTTAIESRVLTACARGILGVLDGAPEFAADAWEETRILGGWDLILTALRGCQPFAIAIALDPRTHPELKALLSRSRDRALAKRLGLRVRNSGRAQDVLSPRELEILGLIRRGLHTREIAEALFIAESTTKVHVRHIFEKLGVRTRAEAVARYDTFNDAR